jgi:hypothetical protein
MANSPKDDTGDFLAKQHNLGKKLPTLCITIPNP